MTIQAQEFAIRERCFNWVDKLEDRMLDGDHFVNSIDLTLRDLALDILYQINEYSPRQVSDKLNYLEGYTGSPDLFCPPSVQIVINDLRSLIGVANEL